MTARLVVLSLLMPLLMDNNPAAAATEARRAALVLPVELGGFFLDRDQVKREVTLALEDRLRAGQIDVARGVLAPSESECREFACLSRIADAHNASLVVAGRLVSNQRVKVSYALRVRVVDRSPGKPVDMRERDANCENCTESQARDQLATLMTAVIANEPEPKAPPPREKTPPPPVLPPQSPQVQTRERFTPPQRWVLRLSGIAALGVGVGFLVQGFVEVARDGDVVIENGQAYRLETATTGQPLFFTLGALSTVAGVALSVLGWKSWPVRVAVAPSLMGGQLVVGGTF